MNYFRDGFLSKRSNSNTIKELLLVLLLDSGLRLAFWYKAVKRAEYLINMLPSQTSRGYVFTVDFLTGDAPNASEFKI